MAREQEIINTWWFHACLWTFVAILLFFCFIFFGLRRRLRQKGCKALLIDLNEERVRAIVGNSNDNRATCAWCLKPFGDGAETVQLRCGHIFHIKCQAKYHSEGRCAICKHEAALNRYNSSDTVASVATAVSDSTHPFYQEWCFRLQRIHEKHPRLVTKKILEEWLEKGRRNLADVMTQPPTMYIEYGNPNAPNRFQGHTWTLNNGHGPL